MGQYWTTLNLDKKEYLDQYKLGCGAKLAEQIGFGGNVGDALFILTVAKQSLGHGGGDFDVLDNWHGSERTFPEHNMSPGPMPEDYSAIAKRTIGRWEGDRILVLGDYNEDPKYTGIYSLCQEYDSKYVEKGVKKSDYYKDITDDVCRVIEHETNGRFMGTGWCNFYYGGQEVTQRDLDRYATTAEDKAWATLNLKIVKED